MSLRSTAGIRRTIGTLPKGTDTREMHGTIKIEETVVDTKIPTKYHIVQQFPIVPHEYQSGYKIYFEDGMWNVVLWPSNTSNYKDEVRYLRSAVDKMMDDIETLKHDSQDRSELTILAKKAELLEISLRELNRQVTREHSERGHLMSYLLDLYSSLFSELPALYNTTLANMRKENEEAKARMEAVEAEAIQREKKAETEVKSLQILLDMQKKWHADIDEQINKWQDAVKSFNDKLKSELKIQKDQYEEQLSELQGQLESACAERDAYRSQIEWEQKSISEREVEVIEIRNKLQETKALLDEREQTLYTTRTHFEKQFTFMREQMGQMQAKANNSSDIEQLRSITEYLPEKEEPPEFLPNDEVNRRIMDIYVTKSRHDGAYAQGLEPPLSKFVLKYYTASKSRYTAAVPVIWQFLASCSRYRHESLNVGIFMRQLEEQNDNLAIIQYMAKLVVKDPVGESGLPRMSIARCVELGARLLPPGEIEKMKRQIERKILDPKKGMAVDFDVFLQILLDLISDVNHGKRQRIMYQFRELENEAKAVDWPAFRDFITRFAPTFSTQKICDLFFEGVRSSLPTASVTASAFQLLVDKGTFEQLEVELGSDIEVANPAETAAFVNLRWISDILTPVTEAIAELRNERMAECHKLFCNLSRIKEQMETPCTQEDAGVGLSLLQLAALILVRYKFVKIARKDSLEAQREVRKIVDLVWT